MAKKKATSPYNNTRIRPGRLTNAGRVNKWRIERLAIGNYPAGMRRLLSDGRAYRRSLETIVENQKGIITTLDAHLIDEAVACEMHAGVCRWLLREKLSKMSPGDIASCSEKIVKVKTARNKAIKQLGLDEEPDVIATLYERNAS